MAFAVLEDFNKMIDAGATRIGASAGVQIIQSQILIINNAINVTAHRYATAYFERGSEL